MTERGPSEGYRREEALTAVARLSTIDPEFLAGLRSDLDSTLWRYGFALSPAETRAARAYFAENTEVRDEDFVRDLQAQLDSVQEFRIWR